MKALKSSTREAVKVILPIIVILVACTPFYASFMGKGEVSGEVVHSWLANDRVVFVLRFSSQKNEHGPRLGEGNSFTYAGANKGEVTTGDKIRLRYNSSDCDGIIVEKLELIDNKPGKAVQASILWLNLPILAFIGIVILGTLLTLLSFTIIQKRIYRLILMAGWFGAVMSVFVWVFAFC